VAGFKRIFGVQGWVELAKSLLKVLVVGGIAALIALWLIDDMLMLGRMDLRQGIAGAGRLVMFSLIAMSAALAIIAAVDVPFQLWSHRRKLKMTRQQVRDELKETDGRPEIKSRIRSLQQQMSKRRMVQEVPLADVVVVNPTHYAVALKYQPDRMRAPKVVAKGAGLIALTIRRLAEEHRVPIFEAPPLARALYKSADIGREIPAALYVAVAQILTYVYQLKKLPPHLAARLVKPHPDLKH
jgi:flagellar biosynthetic protein FlhB